MTFTGFPQDIFRFYRELEQNNTRDWWAENKFLYHDLIVPTIQDFIDGLDQKWRPMSLYRPHRDVRFSPDKTPYKTWSGTIGYTPDGNLHYLHLDSLGMLAARGMHNFSAAQLKRYRSAIDADVTNSYWDAIQKCRGAGFEVLGWENLSTVPKGFRRDHPRAPLLRFSGTDVSKRWLFPSDSIRTRRALTEVQKVWEGSAPVTDWLTSHVGPEFDPFDG